MSNDLMRREIKEAIDAGERALVSLRAAQDQLASARNWGIADMLGGGIFISLMKRNRMDKASSCMEQAKHDLTILQRELKDVQVPMDMKLEISGFLDFADFFFDGLIADWFVQDKINKAGRQVEEAIFRVQNILRDLRGLY